MLVLLTAITSSAAAAPAVGLERDVESRFLTVELDSAAVGLRTKINVLLPSGYETSQDRYPVLYLLHGMQSSYRTWETPEGIAHQAQGIGELIVVMPDAGSYWYVDWPASGESVRPNLWETYLVEELIPYIDRVFRTRAEREGRAIAGHSMGGFGALMLGLRHPELFVSVAGISGYLDYARAAARELERGADLRLPRRRSRPARVEKALADHLGRPDPKIDIDRFNSPVERTPLGRPFLTVEQALNHDPFTLVDRLDPRRLPRLYLDCGTEDALYPFTTELASRLIAKRIPFDFSQGRGGHGDAYRDRALVRLMVRQAAIFGSEPARKSHSPRAEEMKP